MSKKEYRFKMGMAIAAVIFLIVIIYLWLTAPINSVSNSQATGFVAYFGLRTEGELEEIPTYGTFLESQENAYVSDFSGTTHFGYKDPRRIFLKEEVSILVEYEDDGRIRRQNLEIEEVEPGLYRVDPGFTMYLKLSDTHILKPYKYLTFQITTENDDTYYMTWVPPVE